MTSPELALTVRLNTSAADLRRGVVRLHPEALAALGIREWDAIALMGARGTATVAGRAPTGTPAGTILLDDVTMSNVGLTENSSVVVGPVTVYGARSVSVTGSSMATNSISSTVLRQALLGKVVSVGDTVSLLPRDLGPGTSTSEATQALSRTFGVAWTSELLTVTAVEPAGGPVSVQPNSAVNWGSGSAGALTPSALVSSPATAAIEPAPSVPLDHLVGAQAQAAKLTEWLGLALDEPELLRTLGASPHLGVLITGPAGVGKATLARSVLSSRKLVELDGPGVGATEANTRLQRIVDAVAAVRGGGVLLISDIDALLPATAEPVSALILEQLRSAVATPGVAFVATSAHPETVDARLRGQDLCDRELALTLPDGATRKALLELLLRRVPTGTLELDAIASRAPGFVVADLAALCREAALRAATRASKSGDSPEITQEDLVGALEVIRPLSRSSTEELSIGSVTLDDVGDMVETKQALTEAVLWPLQHPDSFARPRCRPTSRRAPLRPSRLR